MRVLFAFMILLAISKAGEADDRKKNPNDIGNSNPGRGVNFYSLEKEIALGKQMAQEVERQAALKSDPTVSEYVNRLGQNLVNNSDARVPFTIKVIDSPEVNAFALPGGFMFVNTGLILKAESEAELAGVLAHEIAYVAARHGTKQATRGEIANLASLPLIFMGGWAGYAIRQATGMIVPMGFMKFSRGMESQADRLGLDYLYKAGYDPLAFLDFFERVETLEKKKPGTIAKLFSSHPPTDARIRKAQRQIQNNLEPRAEYVIDTSEFHDVRNRLAMLTRRRPGTPIDDRRPTLHRRTPAPDIGDRPTLKRR